MCNYTTCDRLKWCTINCLCSVRLRTGTPQHKNSGWWLSRPRRMALAGQHSLQIQPHLWRDPHQQPVGAHSSPLHFVVRYTLFLFQQMSWFIWRHLGKIDDRLQFWNRQHDQPNMLQDLVLQHFFEAQTYKKVWALPSCWNLNLVPTHNTVVSSLTLWPYKSACCISCKTFSTCCWVIGLYSCLTYQSVKNIYWSSIP